MNIKRGDEVEVMRGKARGKKGRVIKVHHHDGRIVIEGINLVKRHSKPSQKLKQGGIIEKEMPIHRSNVRVVGSQKEKSA